MTKIIEALNAMKRTKSRSYSDFLQKQKEKEQLALEIDVKKEVSGNDTGEIYPLEPCRKPQYGEEKHEHPEKLADLTPETHSSAQTSPTYRSISEILPDNSTTAKKPNLRNAGSGGLTWRVVSVLKLLETNEKVRMEETKYCLVFGSMMRDGLIEPVDESGYYELTDEGRNTIRFYKKFHRLSYANLKL